MSDVKRYWHQAHTSMDEDPDGPYVLYTDYIAIQQQLENTKVQMASDHEMAVNDVVRQREALKQQLEQAQGELHEYKESWHKHIQLEIARVRESLKIQRVIARGKKYDEVLMIIEGGDANTIMVAHPCQDLKDRAEHARAEQNAPLRRRRRSDE